MILPDGHDIPLFNHHDGLDLVNETIPNMFVQCIVSFVLRHYIDETHDHKILLLASIFESLDLHRTYTGFWSATATNDPILQALSPIFSETFSFSRTVRAEGVELSEEDGEGYAHYIAHDDEEWEDLNPYLYRHPSLIPAAAYAEFIESMAAYFKKPYRIEKRIFTLNQVDEYMALLHDFIKDGLNAVHLVGPEILFVGGGLEKVNATCEELTVLYN